ncbi:MAG: TonB-dependent receptor [Pedobacter sp.]|nr:MAG: TonB-dependent receptor [Pedobacter sp.]
MKKISALTLFIICCIVTSIFAQTNRKISGTIVDSTNTAIANSKVMIVLNKDTITTQTDEYGSFSISKINADQFTIEVSHMGYLTQKASYSFTEKEKHKKLKDFILKPANRMLNEVIITGKPNPIRFMQDTVEYNAAAYRVNEGDNVADLIKQFPGMEVDEQYGVKTMGKEMVKMRVNGQDFFTSDIKEFIGKLPAGIVSKIQVIDDFGDEANFTGIKIGEPRKMLNIVTKPGMNKGGFGGVTGNAGTNEMIGSGAQFNLWDGLKQSSANLNGNTSNNGAGTNRSIAVSVSHNDKISENMRAGFSYGLNNNKNAFSNEQVIESINPEGNFINNSQSQGDNGGNNHSFNSNMNFNNKKMFFDGYVNADYNNSANQNASFSRQSGIIRQDLNNSNSSKNSAPSLNTGFNFSKKLKNSLNSFSGRLSLNTSTTNGDQSIRTNTLYYDKSTGELQKDSLLNRELNSKNTNQNVGIGFNYSIGLTKPKDTLGRQSINIGYNASASRSKNMVSTFVFDNTSDKVSFVDSLSTSFNSISFNQTANVNYNYFSRKARYNIGLNASPNILSNHDLRLKQTTKNNTFNYSPTINYSKTLSPGKMISMNYQGSNMNPTINQIQPIRNTQSLQNIIVGNPDLKPSFNHNLNGNFNYSHIKTGRSLQLSLNGSATQREIVENVTLIPDTLNSLKQITRYENVNGNYQVNGTYNINVPITKNKSAIGYSGSLGFSNRAVIFNNEKAFGKGLNFSQRLTSNFTFKKASVNAEINYSLTNNNNANNLYRYSQYQPIGIGQIGAPAFFRTKTFGGYLNGGLQLKNLSLNGGLNYSTNHNDGAGASEIQDVTNINMNLSGRVTIKKSYYINFYSSKRINYGYSLPNANPFIISGGLEKSFLKDKSLRFSINANDILGQGNNLSRTVTGNTIIDSRNRQQTRVFTMNLNYNLSKFGGRTFRVDAD